MRRAQNMRMPAAELTTDRSDGWARRRERIAGEIELAALELFAVSGPDDTPIEEVAKAAGISVRTFFRYFRTRDDIMLALPTRLVGELCARVHDRPATEGVLEAFIAAVHEAQVASIDDDLVRLWGRAMQRWSIARAEPQPSSGMAAAFGEVIAVRLGLSASDARVEVMATAIASVLWLAFLRWLASDSEQTLATAVEDAFTVLAQFDHSTGDGSASRHEERTSWVP